MKWTLSIENKLKASLTLLLLCGVVLFSNYRLKHLSSEVAASVQTIYEDRLVVQDIIFSYSKILAQYGSADNFPATLEERNVIAAKVAVLNEKYSKTVLTEEEGEVFEMFSGNLTRLVNDTLAKSDISLAQLNSDLNRLEQIQMEEAKKQMAIIGNASKNQEVSFYLETIILVILLVIVQVLVISNTTMKKVAQDNNHSLN